MQHCIAYTASLDSAVLTAVQALAGEVDQVIGTAHQLEAKWRVWGGWVGSASLERAVLAAPSFRITRLPEMFPVEHAVIPSTLPAVFDWSMQKLRLPQLEQIDLQIVNGGAVAAERVTGVLFLDDGRDDIAACTPERLDTQCYLIHGVSTLAVTANAWTRLPTTGATATGIIWDFNLPEGFYQCLWFVHRSANSIAARISVPGQGRNYRAGALGVNGTIAAYLKPYYPWLTMHRDCLKFYNTTMPNLDVLANAADASHDVWMKVVLIGQHPAREPYGREMY